MKIIIKQRLIGLNEYTNETRRNRFAGANLKKKQENIIGLYIQKGIRFNNPVKIIFNWYEPNRRRDIDNVSFAKKFILDSLVNKGVLINDSQRYVSQCVDNVFIDKLNPRVEIEIIEV